MFSNLKTLLQSHTMRFAYLSGVLLAFLVWWEFTDIAIMLGNYGKIHTYTDIFLSGVMILGFPLFLLALFYKGKKFGTKQNLTTKNSLGTLGGVIGTILSGCSCCGLTLAAYFGFLPLMNLLPYDGLELKILGAAGLLFALFTILRDLDVCKIPKR